MTRLPHVVRFTGDHPKFSGNQTRRPRRRPSTTPIVNNQNPSRTAAETVQMYLMSVSPSLFPFSLGHV